MCNSSWIDPTTPGTEHTTKQLAAHQYYPPPKKPTPRNHTQEMLDAAHYLRKHGHPSPTPAPHAPTQPPTFAPTSSPTPDLHDYKYYSLVMSDEFNVAGRSFSDGADPTWTAVDKNDYTNNALHYYSPTHVTTDNNGNLDIRTTSEKTEVVGFDDVNLVNKRVTKNFKSSMIQTWNKFCFTGGIIEASVELPGRSDVGGLWPAFWLLGNIARHTYIGTSSNVWPWSKTKCDPGMVDAQKLSGCLKTEHYGMEKGVGRGAPEIDIFEVQPGKVKANHDQFKMMPVGQPFSSASLQVAPGKSWSRPGPGNWPGPSEWYNGLKFGTNTSQNINFYGTYNHFKAAPSAAYDYWSDAVSQNRQLEGRHFQGQHRFRLEWEPPSDLHGDGYLHWYLDDSLIFAINGTSISSVTGAEIPSEPSYIIMNTAVSKEWGFPQTCPKGCPCKEYDCDSKEYDKTCGFNPGFCDMLKNDEAHMKIDWVRVYQDPANPVHKVGCSTPERPTRRWIEGNAKSYMMDGDDVPLKKVPRGGGACEGGGEKVFRDGVCGGALGGVCVNGRCSCQPSRTGPHCLSVDVHDDIVWDPVDNIEDVGFYGIHVGQWWILVAVGGVIGFTVVVEARVRRKDRGEGEGDFEMGLGGWWDVVTGSGRQGMYERIPEVLRS